MSSPEGDSLNFSVILVAIVILLSAIPSHCAECNPPKEWPKGGFLDQNCRLGRRVKRDGLWWLERLDTKDLHVKSREAVDCNKAVYDPDGQYYYWPKSFNAQIWCPSDENPNIAQRELQRKLGSNEPTKEAKHGSDGDQH
jgi:hypothetical protein